MSDIEQVSAPEEQPTPAHDTPAAPESVPEVSPEVALETTAAALPPESEPVASDAPPVVEAPRQSIEDQIAYHEAELDKLDAIRMKTVVESLEFNPVALSLVASDRAVDRYARAWKEAQKLIKQCAWSGLRMVQIESVMPTMNETLVHDLVKAKFKAKVVTINGVQKIECRW